MKFRKKPVEIEAVQWDPDDLGTPRNAWPPDWPAGLWAVNVEDERRECQWMEIPTLEGRMRASPGDWIIRGVKGEFYPCKPDIFALTYEPTPPPETPAPRPDDLCVCGFDLSMHRAGHVPGPAHAFQAAPTPAPRGDALLHATLMSQVADWRRAAAIREAISGSDAVEALVRAQHAYARALRACAEHVESILDASPATSAATQNPKSDLCKSCRHTLTPRADGAWDCSANGARVGTVYGCAAHAPAAPGEPGEPSEAEEHVAAILNRFRYCQVKDAEAEILAAMRAARRGK